MLAKLGVVCLIIFSAGLSFGQIQPERVAPSGMHYLEHLPADYNSTSKNYPLIIWLHGTGEVGTNIDKVRYFGISKHIENGHDMTFQAGGTGPEFSFIVMSPQLNAPAWSSPSVKD